MAEDPHPLLLNPMKVKVTRNVQLPTSNNSKYPDVLMRGMDILNAKIVVKNTFYAHEFVRYTPLFSSKEAENWEMEDLAALSMEYFNRISLYHPVYVIEDYGRKEQPRDGHYYMKFDDLYHRILLRFPPVYLPMKTLNEVMKDGGSHFTGFLYRALTQKNRYSKDVDISVGVLKEFCQELSDTAVSERYASMIKRFEKDRANLIGEEEPSSTQTTMTSDGSFDIDKAFEWD